MKSTAELRGLKIISINEGKQISTVQDIILNSDEGRLAFFIVDQPSDYFGARLIAYHDILGLGDYALIITDSSVIQNVAHNSLAIELLEKNVKVVGSQVLTNSGGLIGEVKEIIIDERTGNIAACQVMTPLGKNTEVKCDQVIAYGKEIIIIDDNPSDKGQAKAQSTKTPSTPANSKTTTVHNEKELLKRKIEEFGKSDSLSKAVEDNENGIIYPQDFNVFEQRQLQFLLGKCLNKDILLDTGESLKAGEQITAQLLSSVKTRSTLMQMTAHVVK